MQKNTKQYIIRGTRDKNCFTNSVFGVHLQGHLYIYSRSCYFYHLMCNQTQAKYWVNVHSGIIDIFHLWSQGARIAMGEHLTFSTIIWLLLPTTDDANNSNIKMYKY